MIQLSWDLWICTWNNSSKTWMLRNFFRVCVCFFETDCTINYQLMVKFLVVGLGCWFGFRLYPLMKGDYYLGGYHDQIPNHQPKPPSNHVLNHGIHYHFFTTIWENSWYMLIPSGKLTNSNGTWTRIENVFPIQSVFFLHCHDSLPCVWICVTFFQAFKANPKDTVCLTQCIYLGRRCHNQTSGTLTEQMWGAIFENGLYIWVPGKYMCIPYTEVTQNYFNISI